MGNASPPSQRGRGRENKGSQQGRAARGWQSPAAKGGQSPEEGAAGPCAARSGEIPAAQA